MKDDELELGTKFVKASLEELGINAVMANAILQTTRTEGWKHMRDVLDAEIRDRKDRILDKSPLDHHAYLLESGFIRGLTKSREWMEMVVARLQETLEEEAKHARAAERKSR